ncbi:MAG: 23S rRNA (adenine(2503)-C(2))-methyltransferase RlmN [Pedosphaera sp.]|nr:23S rRNA (adenine(2503)-C(2))-methyltransferase RlmN [Pedosphaera sp.]
MTAPLSTLTPALSPPPVLPDIRDQSRETLAAAFNGWNVPAYRLTQLLQWLYERRAPSWDAMTNLPKSLRDQLAQTWSLGSFTLVLKQGTKEATQKFLWRLSDGSLIESVLIPANPALYGETADRHTLCVSTQVGCAYGCRFCASGLDGWKRNLQPWEIAGQILEIERWHSSLPKGEQSPLTGDRLINNLVIMGMGEPLANYDNLMIALRILNAPWGGNIGARKITISTSGLVPKIRQLAEEPEQFRLAISLHGATDAVRNQIMPVNRKYPVAELSAACHYYVSRKGKMITLEYILIQGVNDALPEAKILADLAWKLHAKVNLIPYNTVEGLTWKRPDEKRCITFAKAVRRDGTSVTLRMEKGHDIDAACGQLRLKTEKELTATAVSDLSQPIELAPA